MLCLQTLIEEEPQHSHLPDHVEWFDLLHRPAAWRGTVSRSSDRQRDQVCGGLMQLHLQDPRIVAFANSPLRDLRGHHIGHLQILRQTK